MATAECLMAACSRSGKANYACALCGERAIFCCEGCEVQILNDLRGVGHIATICNSCATAASKEKSTRKPFTMTQISVLLKRLETFRDKIISEQRFADAELLRDLRIAVRDGYLKDPK